MPTTQKIVNFKPRPAKMRTMRAIWHDSLALWHEFRGSIILFMLVTFVGGFFYGELYHNARGINIPLFDRPYLMLQLMILETPEPIPREPQLATFWYVLPVLFVFFIGRSVADFVRLFFNRDGRRDAWRRALALTYRDHVIVFGVGHVGVRVVVMLAEMGVEVIAIDDSPDPGVEDILGKLHVPLINADGRLPSTLEAAGLPHADTFLACTGNDHVNLEAIMRARDMNPNVRIVARVWDNQFARQIQRFMNVQHVLSSSDLAAPAFAGHALGLEITQTLKVGDVDYSMLRMDVEPGSFLDGATIGLLQEKNDMDIVLHSKNSHVDVQPPRDLVVQAGDSLVIFARHDNIINIAARNRRGSKNPA